MIKPPIARGSIESIAIQGFGSSGRGLHPEPTNAAEASKSGSALEAVALGDCVGLRSSISTSASHQVPLPPSPATMASSKLPSALMRPPLEGPQANSMSRLSTVIRFHRGGGLRSFCTYRQTFWPVASTSLSSRLFTAPRPRRRNFTAYSSGMLRVSARRATTKPPPPLKSKSIRSAGLRPADTEDSSSSALPETIACHSDPMAESGDWVGVIDIGLSRPRRWDLAKPARRASARHEAR